VTALRTESSDGERSHRAEGLDLERAPLLGTVADLDPRGIDIEVSEGRALERITLSDLVALPVATGFMIGLVDSIRLHPGRDRARDALQPDGYSAFHVTPVGTLHVNGGGAGTFARETSVFPHVGGECRLVDGERLHRLMVTLGGAVDPGESLVIGHYLADPSTPAVANGNRMFQRHASLLGSTGAGKSWAVALMLERAAGLGNANVIVFDVHGEYGPLTAGSPDRDPIARGLRIAGPGDIASPSRDLIQLPYWLLAREELMTLALNPSDPHSSDQVFRFSEHVTRLKEISLADAGRHDAVATFTPDSPIPYRLSDLVQLLREDDTETIVRHPSNRLDPGPYRGRLTGFITRLEALMANPRYAFIFNPPEHTLSYDWLGELACSLLEAGEGRNGITVIDLSEVPSSIVPLITGVLGRLVHEVQFWTSPEARTPVCLICDEAHLYLPKRADSAPIHRVALEAFEAIAKEGRKYGVALVVVSQRPSDVSRTILSQCNNFVIMRVTNDYDRDMIERLIPEALSGVTGVLPALDVGEAVVIGDALLMPSRVKFDAPTIPPAGATQPYWTRWSTQASSPEAIVAAAESLRNQYRADDKGRLLPR
jgi:hypothetical protein